MRYLLSFAVLLLAFSSSTALAVCNPATTPTGCLNAADKSCSLLGQTTMDGDEKNLIACLRNNSGHLEWKAMTTSSNTISCSPGTGEPGFWVFGNGGLWEDDVYFTCHNGFLEKITRGCVIQGYC